MPAFEATDIFSLSSARAMRNSVWTRNARSEATFVIKERIGRADSLVAMLCVLRLIGVLAGLRPLRPTAPEKARKREAGNDRSADEQRWLRSRELSGRSDQLVHTSARQVVRQAFD